MNCKCAVTWTSVLLKGVRGLPQRGNAEDEVRSLPADPCDLFAVLFLWKRVGLAMEPVLGLPKYGGEQDSILIVEKKLRGQSCQSWYLDWEGGSILSFTVINI